MFDQMMFQVHNYLSRREGEIWTITQLETELRLPRHALKALPFSSYIQHVKGERPRWFKMLPCSAEQFLGRVGPKRETNFAEELDFAIKTDNKNADLIMNLQKWKELLDNGEVLQIPETVIQRIKQHQLDLIRYTEWLDTIANDPSQIRLFEDS